MNDYQIIKLFKEEISEIKREAITESKFNESIENINKGINNIKEEIAKLNSAAKQEQKFVFKEVMDRIKETPNSIGDDKEKIYDFFFKEVDDLYDDLDDYIKFHRREYSNYMVVGGVLSILGIIGIGILLFIAVNFDVNKGNVYIFSISKILMILFIELLAFAFFRYATNGLRYVQIAKNEQLALKLKKIALKTALSLEDTAIVRSVIQQLFFTDKNFATIVLDEAQAVKNRNTKRSKTVMNLNGDFRLITTGTPIENHLGELWNLFNFINPGLLGKHEFFTEKFALPIEKNNDDNARKTLQKLIKPFTLRRRKNQVLDDLPAKTEIVLTVEMSDEERAFYEGLRREALEKIESQDGEAKDKRFRILAELTKLRLACCHPKLVNENVPLGSSKLELFGETLEELLENKHKALVFSQFVKHLKIVREYLDDKGISYQYLDGSTPPNVRQERIDEFQRGIGDVFLISLKAGGTGLNLTAADYVIHLDPWWNPAVEDQATDRVHRIGQQRPVTVYRLVTENTVEEKILKLHETKRDLADSLLDGTDTSGKLSADDLLALIAEV